jgi:hypothetical protein
MRRRRGRGKIHFKFTDGTLCKGGIKGGRGEEDETKM